VDKKHLAGSKWTRVADESTAATDEAQSGLAAPYFCHWRVVEVSKSTVLMQAILQPDVFVTVARSSLTRLGMWRPGWH
jgi:hypothetical protein